MFQEERKKAKTKSKNSEQKPFGVANRECHMYRAHNEMI